MATKAEEKKPRARKTTGTRTSKKGTGDIPAARKSDIPLELLCPMCNKGMLVESTTEYIIRAVGEREYTILNMPCQVCDTCEGKVYQTDDICRPSSYVKHHDIKTIDHKVAMKEWEKWQEQLREHKKRLK
jgi:YgiT-type zinc finger domain-containing protein